MSKEKNEKKFVESFTDALNIKGKEVIDSLKYQGIPEWDSISHMVLITNLEEKFDISIETDDVIDMSSVGKAKKILKKYGIKI
jgi:acyl carrier protein